MLGARAPESMHEEEVPIDLERLSLTASACKKYSFIVFEPLHIWLFLIAVYSTLINIPPNRLRLFLLPLHNTFLTKPVIIKA